MDEPTPIKTHTNKEGIRPNGYYCGAGDLVPYVFYSFYKLYFSWSIKVPKKMQKKHNLWDMNVFIMKGPHIILIFKQKKGL